MKKTLLTLLSTYFLQYTHNIFYRYLFIYFYYLFSISFYVFQVPVHPAFNVTYDAAKAAFQYFRDLTVT